MGRTEEARSIPAILDEKKSQGFPHGLVSCSLPMPLGLPTSARCPQPRPIWEEDAFAGEG